MKRVAVRRLLDFQPAEFVGSLQSALAIVYEDSVEIQHTPHEVVINRYIFALTAKFIDIPMVSKHSIHNYYVEGQYVAKSINRALEAILEDIIDIYVGREKNRACLELAYETMYKIVEDIYNEVICNNLVHVGSLSITDFLDIQLKPELLEAIDKVRANRDLPAVQNTYEVLDKVIRTSDDLKDNPIAKGYIAGTIASNQVKQLLASRGFVTEIDSTIFKYPIASSFVLGMDNMYDMAVESRSGAKALYLSNKGIPLSEYFAREMQLCAMNVTKLVDGDCGNKDYIDWSVTEKDFKNLLGKHYFLDDGNEAVITNESMHLIGSNIRLRNAMRCKTENKRHICTACMGSISNNIPLHSNLGVLCVTTITAVITQLILSTKHVTTSASTETIVLTGPMKDFFIVKNKDSYAFRANTLNKKKCTYSLHIPQDQAVGIPDIGLASDVDRLNLSRISKLKNVTIVITNEDGGVVEVPLIINQGNRVGSFTYSFLNHIKKSGYYLDHKDDYVVDLHDWPTGVPIIQLPQIEFNYMDLANAVKAEFKSMTNTVGTPEAFLHKIYEILNTKLSVNLALIEVVVYAFTAYNPDESNYDLARGSVDAKPVKLGSLMHSRSLGGAYAWESVNKTILSPTSYYGNNAIDHPLDVLMKPQEVIANK